MLRTALAMVAIAWAVLASAHAAERPGLRLMKTRPVEVHGSGFAPGERVRVVLHAGAAAAAERITASGAGGFNVTFRDTKLAGCVPLSIAATGSAGSRARLLRRNPQCMPG
jgi:hypothetical protein